MSHSSVSQPRENRLRLLLLTDARDVRRQVLTFPRWPSTSSPSHPLGNCPVSRGLSFEGRGISGGRSLGLWRNSKTSVMDRSR